LESLLYISRLILIDETFDAVKQGGYNKMPEETGKAIDSDGWLHSGDLAVMDERGYCKITGGIKNMIIRGGVEHLPAGDQGVPLHPPVGLRRPGLRRPDRRYGEQVMAVVVLKVGTELFEEEGRSPAAAGSPATKFRSTSASSTPTR
jgi:acyl-CoA synthetase (AMP-forming)/AMP-acid ligase II